MVRKCKSSPIKKEGNVYWGETYECKYKKALYKEIFKKCSLCECDIEVEIHHIQPISDGGSDEFINYILLCYKCHRKKNIHRFWREKEIELLTFKFKSELRVLGFSSDEYEDEDFRSELKLFKKGRDKAENYLYDNGSDNINSIWSKYSKKVYDFSYLK